MCKRSNEFFLNFLKSLFLDPAMPLFVTADVDNKLDASDAEFVGKHEIFQDFTETLVEFSRCFAYK